MSSGVEIRMPFMDHRIVCFLFSLPWKSKVGSSYTKRLLRDAMNGIIIDDVIKRRDKIGWNAPLHEWFKDAYSSELIKYLEYNLFDNKIRRKINKFRSLKDPKYMDGQKLWRSILPTLWKRAVLDKDCT
jgi:asparagine synthase (glutamine-hydrolysing)